MSDAEQAEVIRKAIEGGAFDYLQGEILAGECGCRTCAPQIAERVFGDLAGFLGERPRAEALNEVSRDFRARFAELLDHRLDGSEHFEQWFHVTDVALSMLGTGPLAE